jgi:uncharacterized protein YqeY
MSLLEKIQKDMVEAMKAKDEVRLSAVRMIKTALQKHQVDSMKPLDEESELKVLSSLVKQRRESAEMFRKGGRAELAEKEEAELRLIEAYMPEAVSDAELDALIAAAVAETGAASARDMGKVMNAVKGRLGGKRVDGRVLSEKVKTRLG